MKRKILLAVTISVGLAVAPSKTVAATGYVAQLGQTPSSPYATWADAASNIHDAVAVAANTLVIVSNGTYGITSQITFTNATVLRSVNGAANTIVRRDSGTTRIFCISNNNAVIDGFTIRDGNSTVGAGIYMVAGAVQNCIVANNTNSGTGHGGGIYMYDGMVSNCLITGNSALSTSRGGGIYMANPSGPNSKVVNCIITNNTSATYGGGITAGGLIRNCLIARNSGAVGLGGGIGIVNGTASRFENCTIVSNSPGGGLVWIAGSVLPTVTNTIAYFNSSPDLSTQIVGVAYSCSPSLIQGANGNTTANPDFVDVAGSDFRLQPGSPCLDAGTNKAWMTNGVDLAGYPRIVNTVVDMGAYEFTSSNMPFLCNFRTVISPTNALQVAFTPFVSGPDTNITWCGWDFTNGGSYNQTAANLAVVTNVYSDFNPGGYSIRLAVSNASGDATSQVKWIYPFPTNGITYVSTNGLSQWPYHTWAKAATNIQDAVNVAANPLVLVSNGTYSVTSQILLTNSAVLRSVNGAANTIVRRSSGTTRIFCISNNAVVDGFTIREGNASSGGGIYMATGTVQNCIIANNSNSAAPWYGGGIYLCDGMVSNCQITGNSGAVRGGGIFMANPSGVNAKVVNCTITNNAATTYGGGMTAGGTIRNCLIARNSSTSGNYGGGIGIVQSRAHRIESCTIVSNTGGGFVWITGSVVPTMTNTIVYFNSWTNLSTNIAAVAQYSCSPGLNNGVNGNITADPLFKGLAGGDYRLSKGSPCVNSGTNQTWMTNAVDLDGNRRIENAVVDMGAYERASLPKGTVYIVR